MKDRGFRFIDKMITSVGLTCVDKACSGGCHIKARVKAPDGREEIQMFPATTGDRRAHLNKLAELRRFARGISTKTERPQ